jgi:hypothetical protein
LYYGALYFIVIVSAVISTAFYKKWAVSLVPTFIAGLMIYELAGVIQFIPLTRFSVHYFVLCLISYSYVCFFIYRCLTIKNNTVILKEKYIWLSLLAVLFSPLCEELVGRELVFKLIVRNRSKKIVFLLFIVFALIISFLHLNKKVLYLFMRWGLFTVLFFVRYRFPSNRQLWYCVCIHSLWNAGNVMYAILFNTFQ